MHRLAIAVLAAGALLLGGCATRAPMPPADDLLRDDWFTAPAQPVDRAAPLALSPAMREYLATRPGVRSRMLDRRRQLIDALYRGDLKLEYDAASTRTAAQAFDARAGNCLALVLMTAAFAKELDLKVTYQLVTRAEGWNRADDLYIALGHVNLALEDRHSAFDSSWVPRGSMVVDFLPDPRRDPRDVQVIGEHTVLALYFNNRAVESLAIGRTDDAYAYAREAVRTDPELLSAYTTLGVVYRTARRPAMADRALLRVLQREPDNLNALSNRVLVLRDLGRTADANALTQRLAQLDPHPPFSYFHAGRAALSAGRLDEARALFQKEVQRAPYHHEFEYWLAVTYMQLDDPARALQHLQKARDISTTRRDHDLYAGKADRLRALTASPR